MWETKDVLMIVLAVAGVAVTWGIVRTQVGTLGNELRELKRETKASLQKQGERIGELELAHKLARAIAQAAGKGTPVFGTIVSSARGQRSGQVTEAVDDGGSEHEDEDDQRR